MEEGDIIEIDIPNRIIHLMVDDIEIVRRRAKMEEKGNTAWQPVEERKRKISKALKAYAAMTTSAAKGAVRNI
ncbi:dihydroxy-acid dehydratase [Bartonella schoenbuchensis R1]|uniref:Dihydroxy-acid dehydratase n=1 Tax=Bartonella schoenbuchensis (strain DSM 13525 / NCTC 13165 / R1) TaxID=687861 RepID=A0A1S6XN12_BARSR|nr:dihydroxy-acid dehydratase [Bartonella schoenbuchensis R1]